MPPRKTRSRTIEWTGGAFELPTYVDDAAGPYRPIALVWMSGEGLVLGLTLQKPDELYAMIGESFENAIRRPMAGGPHIPTRVRVASAVLAEALQEICPAEIEVVRAPTPEIDAIAASMSAMARDVEDEEQTYLSAGVTADAAAAVFRAAARLHRAAPWKVVPSDTHLFAVSIPALGLEHRLLSIIGQLGESFGVIMLDSAADFAQYLETADAVERGDPDPRPPRHFVLNFDRGAEMSPSLRKEIASHGWEVAGADAYPWIVRVDSDLTVRPPTLDEVVVFETIALGLAALVETEPNLRAAWDLGGRFTRTIPVMTLRGPVDVVLSAVGGTRVAVKLAAKARTTKARTAKARTTKARTTKAKASTTRPTRKRSPGRKSK